MSGDDQSRRRKWQLLETVSTRWFVAVVALLCVVPLIIIALVLALDWFSVKDVNTFVDAVLKVAVALVGAAWALNRLFTTRADAPQLHLEGNPSRVDGESFGAGSWDDLILCHVDATNTGKTLLQGYSWQFELVVVRPHDQRLLASFPIHPMPSIEPGSWAAIDVSTPAPSDVAVIRLLVFVYDQSDHLAWTWRRTWSLVPES